MGTPHKELKSLSDRDAVAKIKHIASGEIAMLCTRSTDGMKTRPMGTPGIDDDGTFWFMSPKNSAKNKDIAADPRVQLIYAVPSRSEFLSLDGTATIFRDQHKIDELWNIWAEAWFKGGKTDPDITLIKITPTDGHYWDTRYSKMVKLAKMAVAAVTGQTVNDNVEGDLNV